MESAGKAEDTRVRMSRPLLLVLCSIGLVGVLLRLWLIAFEHFFNEDALITLRYGRNIIEGNGWIYNTNQHVLGSTSPIWTVVAALASGLLSTGGARLLLSTMDLVFYCLAGWLLVRRICSRSDVGAVAPVVLVAILAFHRLILDTSIGGLEESLFVLLIVAAVLVVERSVPAGFALAGIATLVRPEGLVLAIALLLMLLTVDRRWKSVVGAVLSFVAVITPWVVFATIYFGSPIPQSAKAKSGWIGQHLTLLRILWRPQHLLSVFTFLNATYTGSTTDVAQLTLAVAGLALFGYGAWTSVHRRDRFMTTLALFFVGYVAFYYFGNGELFHWYILPSAVTFWSVTAIGIDALARNWLRRIWILGVGAFVVFLLAQAVIVLPELSALQGYETGVAQATGQWIARCTPADAIVMLEPLGYVGYYSDRRIIDLGGLISPKFASLDASAVVGWPTTEILLMRPDYLVLRRYEVAKNEFLIAKGNPMFANSHARKEFEDNYVPVASFSDHYATHQANGQDISLVVYARNGVSLCH